jgi:transcriptional regulator with XRE-family HTH domain
MMRDWERYEEAKRLRDSGLTLKEVGARLGLSGSRIRQMLQTLERRERQIAREKEDPSLVPWWRGLKVDTAMILQGIGFYSRDDCMELAADELTILNGYVELLGWDQETYSLGYIKTNITIKRLNEVRAWLGVAPYTYTIEQCVASAASLDRARQLLERHGYHVDPPNEKNT